MADITDFQDRFVGQAERITSPNPRLASPIEEDDLIIALTAPLFNEDGVVPSVDGSIVIRNITTGYPEGINVKSGNISADGQTITLDALTQRGQPVAGENGVDYDGGVEDNRSSHPQNSEVRWQISPLDMQMVFDAVDGNIGSGKKFNARPTYTGDGVLAPAVYADATARDAALPSPAAGDKCFLDDGTGEQFYDGVGWVTLGTATPITASKGNVKVGQDIQNDPTDTTFFVKTSSGAADEDKVPVLNSNGDLDDNFIEQNFARKDTLTAKGSMYAASAASTPAEVTIGPDGSIPVADSAESAGVKFTTEIPLATNIIAGTRISSQGSGTENFLHGLGRAPKAIIFSAKGTDDSYISDGYVNSALDNNVTWVLGRTGMTSGRETDACIYIGNSTNYLSGEVTSVDATNITVTWTSVGSGEDLIFNAILIA